MDEAAYLTFITLVVMGIFIFGDMIKSDIIIKGVAISLFVVGVSVATYMFFVGLMEG